MSNEISIYNENVFNHMVKVSGTLAKSNLVPSNYKNKSVDIFLALTMGAELGLAPVQSLQAIHVIQGRPSLSAQTMLALIRQRVPNAYIKIISDSTGASCTMARSKDEINESYTAQWDAQKAKEFGLINKDNWKKQFSNMCRWRAVSEAARFIFPDLIMNLYTPDEVESFEMSDKDIIDKDFPIPEVELIVGPEYRIQNGKFRGKQFKDIGCKELGDYVDYMEKQKEPKNWMHDLGEAIGEYMEGIDSGAYGS